MSFDPVAFAAHFRSLSGHGRQEAIYGLETRYSPEMLDVLFAIAADQDEYDLACIEAVKVLVLAFITELAVHDPHDDVRLHAPGPRMATDTGERE
ncbi:MULTISPECIES: hypothetical protein [unclassified Streptomyces]|uniref:hypothetical protein n=1 Tax=unclassified Streptomyces TaxID=2593676 RepID=UPI0022514F76|nr:MULTISPECIES: hypothetical protein [unclassified Streptomyces]MCX4792913.1 hypothetical protein [Streptomyces sp. NBC_01242]WSP59585.1 hypothetical protein OG306_38415 [Streptomyces sp. NBC_01241]WSP60819.1 hypothetical protein OG466_02020 [Streptomyces sp. NBC_01240]